MRFSQLLTPLLFLALAITALPQLSHAQALDVDISSFKAYQDEMTALVRRQKPRLERIEKQITDTEAELQATLKWLSYPNNARTYRDSAFTRVLEIRNAAEKQYNAMRELDFEWFEYSRYLMAVYTRYGELKIVGKTDQSLRDFLLGHRDIIFAMEDYLERVEMIYNECDYLLNSKLN